MNSHAGPTVLIDFTALCSQSISSHASTFICQLWLCDRYDFSSLSLPFVCAFCSFLLRAATCCHRCFSTGPTPNTGRGYILSENESSRTCGKCGSCFGSTQQITTCNTFAEPGKCCESCYVWERANKMMKWMCGRGEVRWRRCEWVNSVWNDWDLYLVLTADDAVYTPSTHTHCVQAWDTMLSPQGGRLLSYTVPAKALQV